MNDNTQDTQGMNGKLKVILPPSAQRFSEGLDRHLNEIRGTTGTNIVNSSHPRFGSSESKAVIDDDTMRGKDVFVVGDITNYGITYPFHGQPQRYSADDNFADIKWALSAADKAQRLSVVMPMLYQARQDKRELRESLNCSIALQELQAFGVKNVITFDAHNIGVANAIPRGVVFENIPTRHLLFEKYKAALQAQYPNIKPADVIFVGPDLNAMKQAASFAISLKTNGVDGLYKERDKTKVVNGKNPIKDRRFVGGNNFDGKIVCIVDDMISSGDSMLEPAEMIKKRGAAQVDLLSSFSLMTEGFERFDRAHKDGVINNVYTTDLAYIEPEKRKYINIIKGERLMAHVMDRVNRDKTTRPILNGELV